MKCRGYIHQTPHGKCSYGNSSKTYLSALRAAALIPNVLVEAAQDDEFNLVEQDREAQVEDVQLERLIGELRRRGGGYGASSCTKPEGFKRVADEVPGALAELAEIVLKGRTPGRFNA